jgi:hypothetical protein
MPEYQTTQPVHPPLLVEELQAGLVGLDLYHTVQVAPTPDGGAIVYYPETVTESAVAAIVNAHDATLPSAAEELAAADQTTVDAFHAGWQLGQARLGNVGANAIQVQMDAIEAAQIGTVAAAAGHIKTLAEAVEDLARQLRVLKRTVAIRTDAPERLGG